MAVWKPVRHSTKYGIVDLSVGQFVTGRKVMAKELKTTEDKIRTALKLLSAMKIITIETTSHYSVITLTNWDKYQNEENQIPNQIPKPSPSLPQAFPTEEEVKEHKERKELMASFDAFYTAYPRKTARRAAEKAWERIKPDSMLLQKILKALAVQKTNWKDPKFIPHPATWLNGNRWEDEIQTQAPRKFVI